MTSTLFCPVCGAANELASLCCFACGKVWEGREAATDTPDEPLLHARYQPGAHLGSGGYSMVQRARDLSAHGREVAIKQIHLQGLSAEEAIEATNTFNREVSILSTLHHPQVPRLYDYFHDREHWYLVLEYLEGPTLEAYLAERASRHKPIQIDEALGIVLQICTVLEYLHTRQPPVIFRDLKPGNIIRTPGGKLCLIDFGIARHYRPGQARDTQRLGSPGYAAPEQYGHMQTTPRADIYSLGALLHTLISGQDASEHPQGLALLNLPAGDAEARLTEIVERLLAPDPAARPTSAREVAKELTAMRQLFAARNTTRIWQPPVPQPISAATSQQQIMLPLPQQPLPSSATAVPQRLTSRRRALISIGTLAAITVAGGTAWWVNAHGAHYPFVYTGHTQPVRSLAWSPDSKRIASASDDGTVQVWDATNGRNISVYNLAGGSPVSSVAWSNDGKTLAAATRKGQVLLWSFRSQEARQNAPVNADVLAWSPDDDLIASASGEDSNVEVWQARFRNDAKILSTYTGHFAQVRTLAWSPEGTYVASGAADATVQIWSAFNGEGVYTYYGHETRINGIAWSIDGNYIGSIANDGVRVWESSTGTDIGLFTVTGDAQSLAWKLTDSLSASAYSGPFIAFTDGMIVQVYSVPTGQNIMTYTGHRDTVWNVAWSPDGTLLASASLDNTVRVWRAP